MVDIKPRIYQLLTNAGLHCLTEFPMTKLPRLQSPMVTVGGKGVELRPIAIGDYLGADADQNVCTGFLAATTVVLDVYSPYKSGGTACYETMQAAVQVLLAGGTGQTLRKIIVNNVHFDPDADYYRCSALLIYEALNLQVESV